MKKFAYSALSIALVTALTACGGSSDDDQPTTAIGQFVDSAVEGVEVFQGDKSLGVTNDMGQFKYTINGDNLTFKIGKVTLGSSPAQLYVTPEDLTSDADKQTKIMQVLQSLDSDSNPENGITIAKAQVENLAKLEVEHNIDISQANIDPADIVEHAGISKDKVVDATKAREHFAKTKETVTQNIVKTLEGYWKSDCLNEGETSSITFGKLTKADGSNMNTDTVNYVYHTSDCSGAYDIHTETGMDNILEGETNVTVVANNQFTVEYVNHGKLMKEVYKRISESAYNNAGKKEEHDTPATGTGIYGTWRSVDCQTDPDHPNQSGYVYRIIKPHTDNEHVKTSLYASNTCSTSAPVQQIEPEDIVSRDSAEEEGNHLIVQYEEHGHQVREVYIRVNGLPNH